MIGHRLRRMILDLTPMIDIIMILLFGVMIDSVERGRVTSAAAGEQVAEAGRKEQRLRASNEQLRERIEEAEANLQRGERDRQELARALRRQKLNLAAAMAKLLQMDDEEGRKFREKLEELSSASAQRLEKILAELESDRSPGKVYKAIRRIDEMQKVFTFVDLHIDRNNFLTMIVNARELEKLSVRNAPATVIELELRDAMEDLPANQIVLLLFSYEEDALATAVERTDRAVRSLIQYYRSGTNARQLRYGKVGLVPDAPVSVEGE